MQPPLLDYGSVVGLGSGGPRSDEGDWVGVGGVIRRWFLADLFAGDERDGWATASFARSLRRAVLLAAAAWQVVMIPTVMIEPSALSTRAGLVLAHLLLLVLTLRAASHGFPALVVIALAHLLFVADWALVTSPENPLLLAACWQANLAAASPAFVLRGRASLVYPLVAAVVVPVLMVLTNPTTDHSFPPAVFATALAICVATRVGLRPILAFAEQADREHTAAEEERRAAQVRRAASRRAADDARLLHDTVINTLGALANGGAAVADVDAVRARCASDASAIAAIAEDEEIPRSIGLRRDYFASSIEVRHTGIPDAELARREALVPPEVLEALGGATAELVRNAEKHSGASEVRVDVRVEGSGLAVLVSDDGVGFDGHVPVGRGLAESVVGRLRDRGVEVDVRTAPGDGTQVRMVWRAGGEGGDVVREGTISFRDVVNGLLQRSSAVVAVGLVMVGLYLAVTNHRGQPTEEYPMVAVVAVVCLVAWFLRNRGVHSRGLRVVVPTLLTVGACLAFVLSAASVDYGRTDIVLWQAICPVGPVLLLLGVPAWRSRLPWAVTGYAATVVAVAGFAATDSGRAAVAVLVAGAAGLGLVLGWWTFQRRVAIIGRRAASDQKAAAVARTEAEARRAANRARRRWAAAGLRESVVLLRRVADGDLDPRDDSLRRSCGEEEAYLRQLTQLNPELVVMGEWFARALAEARTARAGMTVRSGSVDVDAEVGPVIGELLLRAVGTVPAGRELTTTLFPAPSSLRFTVVGPSPHVATAASGWRGPAGTELIVRSYGSQDLLEVLIPATTAPGGSSAPPSTTGATT